MTIHPLASPYSRPAQPELTGGRKIGVLLSHGFTGQPASMTPWAESLAAKGYAVELPRLPGHGTTWQEMNTTRWENWYAEITTAFEKLVAENDAVVVGGLSMGGALVLRLAEDNADRIAGVMVVNPAIATKRFDVKLLPLLKHLVPSFPGIANDIKKEGVEEHGYTKTPLKAAHSMMQAWPKIAADLPKITAPVIYFRSTVDHVVDEKTQPLITSNISSRDVTVVPLENSYHVATLDNDAPQIFEESAAFIARVTSAS
ncbi:alpha/beta fold hydrolase [Nocardioides sp. CN2-186]|uniref:alpha/beta hydrolase n=1 Tax=Nocardioides tweenelious TaxID=3156607 RepID=UPI0032B37CEC